MRLPAVTARTVDELECVVSVLLAIAFSNLLGAQNVSWAAFSGYMVMRGHVSETLLRGALRVAGTGVGIALGLLIVPHIFRDPFFVSVSLAVVGGLSLYGALTAKRSYAWLFVGLTYVMILFDKVQRPEEMLSAFAWTRFIEVFAGTVACVIVSAFSTVTLRRRWPAVAGPPPRSAGWHPHAARHSAECASALIVLPFAGLIWPLPDLGQAAVTIMAVMLLPLSTLEVRGLMPVSYRMALRVAGCLGGAAFAFFFLVIGSGSTAVLVLGLVIGVIIGRHIENGQGPFAYSGVQFTLALLVVLVPDNSDYVPIKLVYERLLGILFGIALLQPVLLTWHLAARGRTTIASKATESADPGNNA